MKLFRWICSVVFLITIHSHRLAVNATSQCEPPCMQLEVPGCCTSVSSCRLFKLSVLPGGRAAQYLQSKSTIQPVSQSASRHICREAASAAVASTGLIPGFKGLPRACNNPPWTCRGQCSTSFPCCVIKALCCCLPNAPSALGRFFLPPAHSHQIYIYINIDLFIFFILQAGPSASTPCEREQRDGVAGCITPGWKWWTHE